MGSVVRTLPESASMTAISLLRHPINRRRLGRSMAILLGDAHGAVGHRCSTLSSRELIFRTRLSSSRLLKTYPFPSAAANSGPPGRLTVPATLAVATSIAVALLPPPLKAKTRDVAGS